jgi:TPR repeat protein
MSEIIVKWLTTLAMLILLSFGFNAKADFYQVNQQYLAGDYQSSFPQLLSLAQQGNSSAQLTLANAYAKGNATNVDFIQAFAWVMLALDNKHPAARTAYLDYRTKVPSRRNAKLRYKQLKSKYGKDALSASLFPEVLSDKEPVIKHAVAISKPDPEYPVAAYENKSNVWAIAQFDVNENGKTQNVNILAAYPDDSISDAVVRAVNSWQFQSSYDSQNNPVRHNNQLRLFELFAKRGDFDTSAAHQQLLTKAKQGHGAEQYMYAKLVEAGRTPENGPTSLDWLMKSAVNGYAKAQFELYQCLSVQGHCKADPVKALNWLSPANQNGEPHSTLLLIQAYLTPDSPLVNYSPQKAQATLLELIKNDDLQALVLYSKLLATSDDTAVKDTEAAVKYAQQAMALDNNNPHLLSVLAITHYDLGKIDEGQDYLMKAITEAEYRQWPIDHFVNLLEQYQIDTLLPAQVPAEP